MTSSIIGRISFIEFITRHETIVSGVVKEKAVVIGALAIFEALELNLSRLLFLGVVDFFTGIGDVT